MSTTQNTEIKVIKIIAIFLNLEDPPNNKIYCNLFLILLLLSIKSVFFCLMIYN